MEDTSNPPPNNQGGGNNPLTGMAQGLESFMKTFGGKKEQPAAADPTPNANPDPNLNQNPNLSATPQEFASRLNVDQSPSVSSDVAGSTFEPVVTPTGPSVVSEPQPDLSQPPAESNSAPATSDLSPAAEQPSVINPEEKGDKLKDAQESLKAIKDKAWELHELASGALQKSGGEPTTSEPVGSTGA